MRGKKRCRTATNPCDLPSHRHSYNFDILVLLASFAMLTQGETFYDWCDNVDISPTNRNRGKQCIHPFMKRNTEATGNVWSIRSSHFTARKNGSLSFYARIFCPHAVPLRNKSVDGSRPNQHHLFTECPAKISFSGKVGGALTVGEVVVDHNHQVGPEYVKFYASERKLTDQEKEEIGRLLEMKAPVAAISSKLSQETGKLIVPKTIHSLKQVNYFVFTPPVYLVAFLTL